MRRIGFTLVVLLVFATIVGRAQQPPGLVPQVRAAIARGAFADGEALTETYRAARGVTPELAEAVSWLARGTYAAGQLDEAARFSADAYDLAVEGLKTRRLETDRNLEAALGAAIETDALVRAARGDRSSAVYFLEREIDKYRDSPIHKRLQKNLNLLSLEGQPAPALEATAHLGANTATLEDLKGQVVLLFFWAHWCPDCKTQAPVVETVLRKYRAQGLRVVAPTMRFGYIVRGTDAAADAEMRHIADVRDQYYAFLKDEPVPVGERTHLQYGVSTTPTLALVDRQGIVRLYKPGQMTEAELDAAIRKLL